MKTLGILLVLVCTSFVSQQTFKTSQLKYERVKEAYSEKEELMSKLYESKSVSWNISHIFLRVFKKEKVVELWAKSNGNSYGLIKEYKICSASGSLGPKRKQGDNQVPEGFYQIDRFNPNSNFHLSLGINYPNSSDRICGEKGNLGGDIFIHGSCVSIGCMAMKDDKIKELYIAAVQAKANGQAAILVHIFPFRMNEENCNVYFEKYNDDSKRVEFWKNLKTGYESFDSNHVLPTVSVNSKGLYTFTQSNGAR